MKLPSRRVPQHAQTAQIEMFVKCRKCTNCLKLRASEWRMRAKAETLLSSRTWMCTYTVAPGHRFNLKLLSERNCGSEKKILKYLQEYFTRYMKRVREEAGIPLRLVQVAELHKDGFPHLHALIHERGYPVTKRLLQKHWRIGFTEVHLVKGDPNKAAAYVAKYISKDARSRVRSSLKYGDTTYVTADEVGVIARPTKRKLISSL